MSNAAHLTLEALTDAVRSAAAIRAVLRLQPAGGRGAKVFPSTYGPSQDGKDASRYGETKYAVEQRLVEGRTVDCVLLDSVASQANRVELALRDAWDAGELDFPVVSVDFSGADLPEPVDRVTTLDAPHRIYDAILRDSVALEGDEAVLFRHTLAGKAVSNASPRDATALYHYCPTALVFGAWDSTGPKGGMGSKFPRAFASEIVAVDAQVGTRVASRIDPLQITKVMGVVFKGAGGADWTVEPPDGKTKAVAPSEINHGNVTPTRDRTNGGVTFDHARQTSVLSLPALRRLKFLKDAHGQPLADRPAAELAARTALAALALAGLARLHAEGHDLRSGTLLVGAGPLQLEVVGGDGGVTAFALDSDGASALVRDASERAAVAGLAWEREPLPPLKPAEKLVFLLRKSQEHQLVAGPDADGTN